MIHPDTTIKAVSEIIGNGVFATKFIPKGTIVVVRDKFDIVLTAREFESQPEIVQQAMERHMYRDNAGRLVLSWDHARYMNHNCNSNTLICAYDIEIAVRDIHAGQEITSDYGLLNILRPYEISCGCDGCRQHLRTDDIDNFADKWDDLVLQSLLLTQSVPQPLEGILTQPQREKLVALLDGREEYISVRTLKCAY